MASQIINEQLHAYRDRLDSLLGRVQALATHINNADLQRTTHNLRRNINEPFLFVVVGEVKAGKSSFVNALLEAEVCATDIEPCTDSIQQIVYAEVAFTEQVEPSLRKIGRPIPILQDISVVDTPGTNTVIDEHQIITERYIPNSDLTFFVLFAKNPYQKSAWDFLDFVSAEWRKKVVFILQQADLLRPADLQTNLERVREYAYQKQIKAPIIFPTSAVLEQEGDGANSGFGPVRQYIQAMVSSGESYKIKLRSVSQTTQQIIALLNTDVEGAQHFVDGIRQLFDGLNQDLDSVKTHRLESSHISLKVLERRQEVIESVMAKVANLMADQGLGDGMMTQAGDMANEIVGGAIMAVAGTILHVVQFAVAEAILSAIGIAFAGVGVVVLAIGILWQRNRIIGKFEQALDSEKARFQQEVAGRLNEKLGLIYEEVERIFTQFYDYVEREEAAVQPVLDQYQAIQQEATALFSTKVLDASGAERR